MISGPEELSKRFVFFPYLNFQSSDLFKICFFFFLTQWTKKDSTIVSSKRHMVDIPEQWGIPTDLVMSILWLTSWVIPRQSKVPYTFPLDVGSVLLGHRALVYTLEGPAFSFSSISFFSFLFSFCRWTITLWRWLGKEREGQVGVWSVPDPWTPSSFQSWCSHACSVEMEAYVHPQEEAQAWGWGGPRISTPDPLCHVSSGLVFLSVRWGPLSLICLLGFI